MKKITDDAGTADSLANLGESVVDAINGCCVGVSTETVLQMDKFYTVVRRIFELTFRTVVLC